MTIARSVKNHLDRVGVDYELLYHEHSKSSRETARHAHLPPAQVAKAVMTRDRDNYLLCVIPTANRLVLSWLNSYMHGDYQLVGEAELSTLFTDCEVGAVPAFGQVYGFPVIWDDSFAAQEDIYIEAGDHENLIHLNRGAFMELLGLQEHVTISRPEHEASRYPSH